MWRNRIKERTTVKAAALLDHTGNWRMHPEAQKAGMIGVLEEVGIVDALTVYRSEARGGLVIIDGHLRKSIDVDQEWPVDVLDVTDAEADYILATKDPLAAAAIADREKLGALLHNVKSGEAGVQALLSELAEREGVVFGGNGAGGEVPDLPQVDRAEELQAKWQVRAGDLWIIPSKTADGEHRVICGDCTDKAVVERVMGGEKARLVYADPPYGYDKGIKADESIESAIAVYLPMMSGAPIEQNTWAIVDTPKKHISDFIRASESAGWKTREPVLHMYRNSMANGVYGTNIFELSFVYSRGNPQMNHRHLNGVDVARKPGHDNFHPTQKFVESYEHFIEMFSNHGTIIYDPFLGSGTTMVAAERLGRLGRGIEIEPRYVAVSLQRLKDLGLEPHREGG